MLAAEADANKAQEAARIAQVAAEEAARIAAALAWAAQAAANEELARAQDHGLRPS